MPTFSVLTLASLPPLRLCVKTVIRYHSRSLLTIRLLSNRKRRPPCSESNYLLRLSVRFIVVVEGLVFFQLREFDGDAIIGGFFQVVP